MIRITRGFKLTINEGPELGGVGYGIAISQTTSFNRLRGLIVQIATHYLVLGARAPTSSQVDGRIRPLQPPFLM